MIIICYHFPYIQSIYWRIVKNLFPPFPHPPTSPATTVGKTGAVVGESGGWRGSGSPLAPTPSLFPLKPYYPLHHLQSPPLSTNSLCLSLHLLPTISAPSPHQFPKSLCLFSTLSSSLCYCQTLFGLCSLPGHGAQHIDMQPLPGHATLMAKQGMEFPYTQCL